MIMDAACCCVIGSGGREPIAAPWLDSIAFTLLVWRDARASMVVGRQLGRRVIAHHGVRVRRLLRGETQHGSVRLAAVVLT